MSIAEQNHYIQGLEDGIGLVKTLFSLSLDERLDKFGEHQVATILDRYDFTEIKERLETLSKYYVIRGIREECDGVKKCVVESDRLTMKPDDVLINAFLNCHKKRNISFVSVETIYIRE